MTTTIEQRPGETEVRAAIAPLLIDGEDVLEVHDVAPDHLVFTNRRLLVVDHQWLGNERTVYRSVPYRSVSEFSVEVTGADTELVVDVLSGRAVRVRLPAATDGLSVAETLARHVLL